MAACPLLSRERLGAGALEPPVGRVAQCSSHRLRHGIDIAYRHEETKSAVSEDFARTTFAIRAHNGQARLECFNQHQRKPLIVGRQDEEVPGAIIWAGVTDKAGED